MYNLTRHWLKQRITDTNGSSRLAASSTKRRLDGGPRVKPIYNLNGCITDGFTECSVKFLQIRKLYVILRIVVKKPQSYRDRREIHYFMGNSPAKPRNSL